MFRKAIDGGLWVPMRGTPLPAPLGYECKKINHYYKTITCKDVDISIQIKASCGCRREVWNCKRDQKETSRALCERCNREAWLAMFPGAVEY